MSARWHGVAEPALRPGPRHARPAPLPWRDRLTLGLGLPLLSVGSIVAATQQADAAPVAVSRPDTPPVEPESVADRSDRTASHTDRTGGSP